MFGCRTIEDGEANEQHFEDLPMCHKEQSRTVEPDLGASSFYRHGDSRHREKFGADG